MKIDGVELTQGDRVLIKGIPISQQSWWRKGLHYLHIRRLKEPSDNNGLYTVNVAGSDQGLIGYSNGWEVEEVREYLDDVISEWRRRLIVLPPEYTVPDVSMCRYYIDAYQSVRVSLLGELLPMTPEQETWLRLLEES